MICPQCNEPQAHRSHRGGFADWALGLMKRTPYSCRACKSRIYVYRHGESSTKLRTSEEQRIMKIRRKYKWKQSKRRLLAYGFCMIVLIAILFMLLQQRIPPSD